MGKKILAVYDEDQSYARHLMEYLNHNKKFLPLACMYTKEESLLHTLEEKQIDILLTAEGLSGALAGHRNIKRLLWLSEEEVVEENRESIYKYQPAREIMGCLLHYCGETEGHIGALTGQNGRTQVIYTFFSPCGTSESSIFAEAAGISLGKTGHTLFLDLQPFSTRTHSPGLSDLLYYSRQQNTNLITCLSKLIVSLNGIDYLGPVDTCRDLHELTGSDIESLLRLLERQEYYTAIVADVGFYSESLIRLFTTAGRLFLTQPEGGVYKRSMDRFEEELLRDAEENSPDRVTRIVIGGELSEEFRTTVREGAITNQLIEFAERMIAHEGRETDSD